MTDRIFLDTNIIVYAFDKSDLEKNHTAKDLLDFLYFDDAYMISTQVLTEFCNIVFKKIKPQLPQDQLDTIIASFPNYKIISLDRETIRKAIQLKYRYQVSFWDGLIIASALLAGCTKLFSEDMSDGQCIENLQILNPFKKQSR